MNEHKYFAAFFLLAAAGEKFGELATRRHAEERGDR